MPRPLRVTPGAAVLWPALYYLDTAGLFAAALPGILLHELAHAAAIRLCGGRVISVTLGCTGLCMEKTALDSVGKELFCILAGPAAGLLSSLIFRGLPGEYAHKCFLFALALNLFNLLPALPLDGGQALLLMAKSPALLRWSGAFSAIACILLGCFGRIWGLAAAGVLLLRSAVIP